MPEDRRQTLKNKKQLCVFHSLLPKQNDNSISIYILRRKWKYLFYMN